MRRFEIGFLAVVLLGALTQVAAPSRAAAGSAISGHAVPKDIVGEYRGAKDGCRKCHLKQYRSWQKTPHAKSLEALSGAERNDPECLRCHTTGYGSPTGYRDAQETPQLAFVGCEACHGAGSGYREKEIMKDLDAATANGLVLPDEQACRGCHNEDSPEFPGVFVYEEMRAKGVHDIKKKS